MKGVWRGTGKGHLYRYNGKVNGVMEVLKVKVTMMIHRMSKSHNIDDRRQMGEQSKHTMECLKHIFCL